MNGSADPPRPGAPGAAPAIGRVLQDSSLYLLGNVLSRLIGFFMIPFYARFLSPAQYGLLELIELSTQTVTIALGLQAIGAALSRLFHDETTREGELAVVSTSLITTGMFSAVVTALAIGCAGPISQGVFHTDEWTHLLRAAFLAMFLGEMVEVVLVYERIRNRARFFLIYSLVTMFALMGLNILFIGVLGFGVWGFVSSKLVVTSISCVFLLTRAQREVGWRWRSAYVPGLVKFGAPLVLSSLSYFAIHFSDRFFLSSAVSLAELGRYALSYRFAILVSALVGDSFNKSWSVTLYRYIKRPDWRDQFARVASYLTFVLFVTGLGIALFSPELLRVMVPADYLPPPLLLPLLIGSYLAREIGDFFRTLLLINKRSGLVGRIALASAIANLVLNALLIPTYGLYGAAGATVLTWLVYMVICWVVANAEHRLPVRVWAYVRLAVLVTAVYALAAATRVGPVLVQGLLDGVWLLVFCVACPFVFFNAAERRGVMGLAGTAVVWALVRGKSIDLGPSQVEGVLALTRDPSVVLDGLARHDITVVSVTELPGARPGWAMRGGGLALAALDRLARTQEGLSWLPSAYASTVGLVGADTVLYSAGPPTACHLAALALKRRFARPWIAELGAETRDIGIERMIVEQADALILPDAASEAAMRQRHPELTASLHVAVTGGALADLVAMLSTRETGAADNASAF